MIDTATGVLRDIGHAALLFLLGVLLAIGRLLQSDTRPPWNVIVGRSLVTGVLSLSAGSAIALIPGLPLLALLGISAGLASLGTGALERIVVTIFKGRP